MVHAIGSTAMALIAIAWAAAAGAQETPPPTETAQQPQPADEEIIVRGRRMLFTLRNELQAAREHVWDVFNDINSNDDFDISCGDAARTGTRIPRRVCRPKFANDGTRQAGRELLRLMQRCNPTDGACLDGAMAMGTAKAQAQMGRIAGMDRRLDEEFQKLVRQHPDLAIAILEYQAKAREWAEATRADKD